MTDPRSTATRQADLHMLGMILADVDLSRPEAVADVCASLPLSQPGSIEFVALSGKTILLVKDTTGIASALYRLAEAMAEDPDRQYLEHSCVMPSGRPDLLRIAVLLTPVAITLEGLRANRYGIIRLQEFEMAHAGIDAETLPAEQAEAVNLVRETLGVA